MLNIVLSITDTNKSIYNYILYATRDGFTCPIWYKCMRKKYTHLRRKCLFLMLPNQYEYNVYKIHVYLISCWNMV